MTTEEFKEKVNSITDEDLSVMAEQQISRLCSTGGQSFRMSIPVSPHDTDVILSEIVRRFKQPRDEKMQQIIDRCRKIEGDIYAKEQGPTWIYFITHVHLKRTTMKPYIQGLLSLMLIVFCVAIFEDEVSIALGSIWIAFMLSVYINHIAPKEKQDPPQDQPQSFMCYEKYKVDSRTCRWQCSECRYKQYLDERYNNTL